MSDKLVTVQKRIAQLPQLHQDFINEFIQYKSQQRKKRYSNHNVITYMKQYRLFAAHMRDKNPISITKDDLISYLDTKLKTEQEDPQQKCIRTWNDCRTRLLTIYRYHTNKHLNDERDWDTPDVFRQVKPMIDDRTSSYDPDDVWDLKHLLTFVKYVPEIRNQVAYTLGFDMAGRPDEMVKIQMKHLKLYKEYGEVTIPFNTKTGERTIPLIHSFPYIVKYMANGHPSPHNRTSFLLISLRNKKTGINPDALWSAYNKSKQDVAKLLEDGKIEEVDIDIISEILEKPGNPYLVGRHSSITEMTDVLPTDQQVKQFAGWTKNSKRMETYVHRSSKRLINPILELNGIVNKEKEFQDVRIRNKCPKCNQPLMEGAKICPVCLIGNDDNNEITDLKKEISNLKQVVYKILNNSQPISQ